MVDGKITVFLGFANGFSEDDYLNLEEEERELDSILDELRNQDKCFLIRERRLTPEKLFQYLQEYKGELDIFHFSGHADEGIFYLKADHDNDLLSFPAASIVDLIKNQTGGIKLLFLNACNTEKQAIELSKLGAKAVIATSRKVDEEDALVFTQQFYKSLSSGSSIKEAFKEAEGFFSSLPTEFNGKTNGLWKLISSEDKYQNWTPFPRNQKRDHLNFLQLSDATDKETDLSGLLSALESRNERIDLILYTGNITSQPENLDKFREDHESIVKRLCQLTGVSPKNIIFCPGRRDLDLDRILPAIHKTINHYKTNEDISDFINSGEQFEQSCNPSENYRKVISGETSHQKDIFNDLTSIHFRNVGGKRLGIVSINCCWSINGHTKEVVFPIDFIESAFEEIKTCEYKILLSNLDLSNLKPFNKNGIENLIYSKFDFLFFGSSLDGTTSKQLMSSEGIYQSFSGINSSSVLDYVYHSFDIQNKRVSSYSMTYIDGEGCTIEQGPNEVNLSFPSGREKGKQVKLVQVLNKWLVSFYDQGDSLFVDYNHDEKSFTDLFTTPIIREKAEEELQSVKKEPFQLKNKFSLLLKSTDNFLILGKDKSGKSSLLIYVAIRFLEKFNRKKIIPIYIDLKNYKYRADRLDILRIITNALELNKRETLKLIQKYHFRLLLDNFDPNHEEVSRRLTEFLDEHKTCSYIISSDHTTVRSLEPIDFGFNSYLKLYIHEISRSEIRTLVAKSVDKPDTFVEQIVQRLIKVFRQYRMPFNFWTVSVFIWILSRRRLEELEIQNNSELIELYIQELLGQRELAYDKSNKFSFPKYKQYLSFLAWKLYNEHEEDCYSTNYETLLRYTNSFISRSKRHVTTAHDIVQYVLERGVLKRVSSENYSFRLNGTFEYFLAKEMLHNKAFLAKIFEQDSEYLSLRNELDLYSGFEKNDYEKDRDLLTKVYEKTKQKFEPYNNEIALGGTADKNLVNRLGSNLVLDVLMNSLNVGTVEPLSYESKDLLETEIEENLRAISSPDSFNNEVQIKRKYDENSNQLETLEGYLFIMSRVFRNIEVDSRVDEGLDEEILEFILTSTCNLGFLLIDDMAQSAKAENLEDKYGLPKILLKLIGTVLPLIVQDFFYNSVGHLTLENMVEAKIKELEIDASSNQLKLFILYFTMLDLNLRGNKQYLDKIFAITTIGTIKTSILTKILYYLVFKAYNDKGLIGFLKKKFHSFQMKINPKTDERELSKKLSEFERIAMIKRGSEK